MEIEKKKGSTKKTIFIIIGALLIIGTLASGNLKYISDWSTSEMIGYNVWTIIAIFGGAYLVYMGVKK